MTTPWSAVPGPAAGRVAGVGSELFAYGTLQFGPVVNAVIGRMPDIAVAVARDWRVAALPRRPYPGLVARPGRLAGGVLLRGLTPADWAFIDAFEDAEYELRPIHVVGREPPVPAYVWTAEPSEQDWHATVFAAGHLDRYTQWCQQWRRGFTAGQ